MTVKCPRCKRDTELAYEGSHDWTLECGGCALNLTVYVRHGESEAENARIAVERITIHEDDTTVAGELAKLREFVKMHGVAKCSLAELTADAVAAERERCARIAEGERPWYGDDGDEIAERIRSGE